MVKSFARVIVTLLIVAAGCAGGYELWDYYMYSPWTRDARIRADVVTISPDVSGFVTDLRVRNDQFVHKGDILLVIDQARYRLALADAQALIAVRSAQQAMFREQYERRSKVTNLSISAENVDSAERQAESATASYQQAVASRDIAALNLERTVVRAPVNGIVSNLTLVVGQYAAVGTKLIALIDSDSYRVEGYFEETKIQSIKPGDRAEIHLMSGGPALRGHVESISSGITDRDNPDGPELLANVTPTFEWVRLAQRIPTRIHIDEVPENIHISSGMTCTVVVAAPARELAIMSLIKNGIARWAPAAESR